MTTLTIQLSDDQNRQLKENFVRDGWAVQDFFDQVLQSYAKGTLVFGEKDSDITAEFDVSTESGKLDCIANFAALS
jgi:hypothetical protein